MKIIKFNSSLLITLLAFFLVQCKEEVSIENKMEVAVPQIAGFHPASAGIGDTVAIIGTGFQFVDKVMIGEQEAKIKYKINSERVIIEITEGITGGKIKTFNSKNESTESVESFSLAYKVPTIDSWPSQGRINDSIFIEGENFHYITAIKIGENNAPFVKKSDQALIFSVPSTFDDYATLVITYSTSEGEKTISGDAGGFAILKPMPSLNTIPGKAMIGTDIMILGNNMHILDSVFVGDQKTEIVTADQMALTIKVPNDQNLEGQRKITAYYYGGRKLESATAMRVITKQEMIFFDYEAWTGTPFEKRRDILPTLKNELNGNPAITAPEGNFYGHLGMVYDQALFNNAGSTYAELNFKGENNNINLSAFQDPWVHMWINTNNTNPYFIFFADLTVPTVGVDQNRGMHYVRRFNSATFGEGWQLFAWRMKDMKFRSTATAVPYSADLFNINNLKTFRIQLRTTSDVPKETAEFNIDLFMVVEGKLNAAHDVTNYNQ